MFSIVYLYRSICYVEINLKRKKYINIISNVSDVSSVGIVRNVSIEKKEWDLSVLFKFHCEFDVGMSAAKTMQKSGSGGESVTLVSKPNGRSGLNITQPALLKMTHKNVS